MKIFDDSTYIDVLYLCYCQNSINIVILVWGYCFIYAKGGPRPEWWIKQFRSPPFLILYINLPGTSGCKIPIMRTNTAPKNLDKLMSEVFNYLRFPLIVGVIFIHNGSSTIQIGDTEFGCSDNMPMFYYVSTFISNVISRIAVPLFFLMSGYLFFYKVETFNNGTYLLKLKKRFKSLLIPFIFWTTALLCIFYILSHLPFTSNFFATKNYTLEYVISSYWAQESPTSGMTYPLAYQFWFIRDLIVCVIISPILYYIVSKTKVWGIIFIGTAWFFNLSIPYLGFRGFSTAAIFFFSLGAWVSTRKLNIIVISRELKFFGFSYPIIAIADLLTKNYVFNAYIHNLGIISGIIFCFLLVSYLLENNKIKSIPLLSSASFFIFAIHDPWLLRTIKKILYMVIRPESDLMLTLLYFIAVILVIIISVGIYYALKNLTPRFTSIITGGR